MSTTRPTLLYDGDCGFCTRSVRFIVDHIPTLVTVMPWQEADLDAFGVTAEQARGEVLWIGLRGDVHGGAAAVAQLLRHGRGAGWHAVGYLLRAPVVRTLAEAGYRVVAANRHRLPGTTPACELPLGERPGDQR